jgi:dynactin complex subunit
LLLGSSPNMSEFVVGQRVEVTEKQVCGTIAFVGVTQFASGKWIGVVLDEPKGKNNGTVKDVPYFQCEDLHGIFVRQTQLTLLSPGGEAGDSGGSGQSSAKTSPSGAGPVSAIKKSPK